MENTTITETKCQMCPKKITSNYNSEVYCSETCEVESKKMGDIQNIVRGPQ